MALKVYGWSGWRAEAKPAANGSRQTREIAAAKSVAEILRITGMTRADWKWSGGETGNDEEIQLAMSEPGTVFWSELDITATERNWRKS